jgi:xanthine dehydrogenase accessory factor
MLFELLGPAELRTLEGQAGGPARQRNEEEHIAAKSTNGFVLLRPLASGLPALLVKSTGDMAGLPDRAATALATLRASAAQTVALSGDTHTDMRDRWLAERLSAPAVPFYVYGTGLLAQALVRALAGLPFDVVWIDQDPDRFPASPPAHVTLLASDRQPEIARSAPAGAFHAVMTVSHDLDFAIVRAALETGDFAYLGVIGSRMKRKRLHSRLAECGIPPDRLARLICPIGLPEISSKTPAVIAVSIAAQALQALQARQPGTASQGAVRDHHGVGSNR